MCLRIPFENLSVFLRDAASNGDSNSDIRASQVSMDPAALERKVVVEGRGGYCFELNSYLHYVLRELGFAVRTTMARVNLQQPEPRGRTHFLNVVVFPRTVGGRNEDSAEGADEDVLYYLVDVAFGGPGYVQPLLLQYDAIQCSEFAAHRLVLREDGQVQLQMALFLPQAPAVWKNVYFFPRSREYHSVEDLEIGNYFVSVHPSSACVNLLLMSVFSSVSMSGGKATIMNTDFALRKLSRDIAVDGKKRDAVQSIEDLQDPFDVVEQRTLKSRSELLQVLREHFGIDLRSDAVLKLPFPLDD